MFRNKLDFDFETNQSIYSKLADIEKFQGKWEALEMVGDMNNINNNNNFLTELRKIATIQSIGSSTRIEGSQLSNKDVKNLLEDLEINKLETRDEQEVIGYWEVLNIIIENADNLDLTENYIFQLHSLLLKYSTKDSSQKGKYKNLTNKVVANYPSGIQKVIFNTTEPHLVKKEMESLINWTNKEIKDAEINPIIVIATFVYEFLSIHPFHDGNGRLSRLLTTLLLIKSKYNFVQYVSFEHIIEESKKEYYKSLMECQSNRTSDITTSERELEKIDKWLIFFLNSLLRLTSKLDNKVEQIKTQGNYLNLRQKKIQKILLTSSALKVSDIHSYFPDTNIYSIKKDLADLVSKNIIQKKGERKSTMYFILDL